MGLGYALLLAALQGVAEFLPVSSSGHLALAQILLPGLEPDLAVDILLHVATLAAVVVYFRRDLWVLTKGILRPEPPNPEVPFTGEERRTVGLLLLATIGTVAVAFPLRDLAEAAFHNLRAVGLSYFVTAALLLWCGRAPGGNDSMQGFAWWRALLVGVVQGLAVFPGISRSGATIGLCLLLGMERRLAARFSLLLSIPAILGAFVLKAADLELSGDRLAPLLWACVTAFGVGLASIHLLVGAVRGGWFHRFAWYCLVLAVLVVALSFLPG